MFNHFRNQFAVKATYFQELLRSMARNSRRTSLSRETLAEFQVAKSSKENQTNFKKHFPGPASETLGFLCVLWPDRTATNYICSTESTDGYPDREKPSHLWEQSLELAERRLRRARPRPQPSLCLPWCWRAARPQLT